MQYQPRDYQIAAIKAALSSDNTVLTLPTGSGKSLVCAGLVAAIDDAVLVLQPSAEILETNLEKARAYGVDAEVYSASAGRKNIGHVTYATIGSIIRKLDQFSHVKTVIIDECHLVNAKGGMYETLISTLRPSRLIGMTATPYRLHTNSFGSSMRILVRTRPKIFADIGYVINPRDLVKDGYLLRPEYHQTTTDNSMLRANSTGAEFSDSSVALYSGLNKTGQKGLDLIQQIKHKHVLVFCSTVADSRLLVDNLNGLGINAAEINATTDKKLRAQQLSGFRSGAIKVMSNVGTLTTGYDFPSLDCIVDLSPTMSAGLHYQKIGRVVRPYPNKTAHVYDLAGNVNRIGDPLNFVVARNRSGLYEVYSDRGRVTTRIMGYAPECDMQVSFGAHNGKKLSAVDEGYLDWGVENLKNDWKHIFFAEKKRRDIIREVI